MLLTFVLLVYALGVGPSGAHELPAMQMDHRIVMDQWGTYVMLWKAEAEEITFEIQVKTRGYVGLGFSPTGGMKGADIVIGWIDGNGEIFFKDRHALGNRTPTIDPIQDYILLGGYKNDSHTVLRFSRPWITCDAEHDFQIKTDTVRVIWAYDNQIPPSAEGALNTHDHRGTQSLFLKEMKQSQFPDSRDVKYWDVRSPNVEIPSNFDTLYWCTLHKIPDLRRKHQVIGYQPLISEASLAHVHHMLFYECHLSKSEVHLEKWASQKGSQCYTMNMPDSWISCSSPIVMWGIGSRGEMNPDDVGFPLGEEYGGATYFLLEVHYNNPSLIEGIVDNSGLRLILTDKLRTFDGGILTVGHKVAPSLIVPPNIPAWPIVGHCTSGCTSKTLPINGIQSFGAALHAHLLGSGIKVQHIRDGIELPPLVEDNTFDFNYQQARIFSKKVSIKPGDHLKTTCLYNSKLRDQPTFGGFSTKEEMCLVFIYYYPRMELAECHSEPDLSLLFETFGVENIYNIDKIMNVFSQGDFDEATIDADLDQIDLESMKRQSRPGKIFDKFCLADFFRMVNISEPFKLRGKSFFDLVNDAKTYDSALIGQLKRVLTKLQFESGCLTKGRKMVTGVAKKAKVPVYTPYNRPPSQCRTTSLKEQPTYVQIDEHNQIKKGKGARKSELSYSQQSLTHQSENDESRSVKHHSSKFTMAFFTLCILLSK